MSIYIAHYHTVPLKCAQNAVRISNLRLKQVQSTIVPTNPERSCITTSNNYTVSTNHVYYSDQRSTQKSSLLTAQQTSHTHYIPTT